MAIKLIPFLVYIFVLNGCKKDDNEPLKVDDSLACKVEDYYSGEPIEDAIFSFDVVRGTGWNTNIEKSKYYSLSDENGVFVLRDLGADFNKTFYPNFAYHSNNMDTLLPEWRYFIDGQHSDSLWINEQVNTTLRLRPAAITYFHHPFEGNNTYTTDTIVVTSHYQSDTITKSQTISQLFHLLPSANQQIALTYLKDGVPTNRTMSHYISRAFENMQGMGTRRYDFHIFIPE